MSERERWIVYPLLFLALGAALRDKIIKTTESQRIKCQGLCVFDENEQPLLILGAEQFPELRANAPNFLRVDELHSDLLVGDRIESSRFVVTDGSVRVNVDTKTAVTVAQLLQWVSGIAQRLQPAQLLRQRAMRNRSQGQRPNPKASTSPKASTPPKEGNQGTASPEASTPAPVTPKANDPGSANPTPDGDDSAQVEAGDNVAVGDKVEAEQTPTAPVEPSGV